MSVSFIGYGEASRAFASAGASAFDIKLKDAAQRDAMLAAMEAAGVVPCDGAGGPLILSLVTADQALAAAQAASERIGPGALFLDMNSVAPDTKRAAAKAIEAAGGRYVDVAVMAPVHPKRLAVPLLVSGSHADVAVERLAELGFTKLRVIDGGVGAASAVKMIRSVMVKGIEALSAECALAADAAGVLDEVVASLDASEARHGWRERFDYNLDRMMVHGGRRAAEMEEVVATLDALGTGSAMSRGTIERQRDIGARALTPPDGLDAKLSALTPPQRQDRAA